MPLIIFSIVLLLLRAIIIKLYRSNIIDIVIYCTKSSNSDYENKISISIFKVININKDLSKGEKNNIDKVDKDMWVNNKRRKIGRISYNTIVSTHKVLKEIEVYDLYSVVEVGKIEQPQFTSFINTFINTVYGLIVSYLDPEKLYLSTVPNYVEDKFTYKIKIHIKVKIKDIANIIKCMYLVYKDIKTKRGMSNESCRINKRYHGNNN